MLALLAAVVGLALVTSSSDAAAAAHGRARGVPVLHVTFRSLGSVHVQIDGPRVLLGGATLIDESANTRTSIVVPSGCRPAAIGGPWIAANCRSANVAAPYALQPGFQPELYSIPTRTWMALPLAPSLAATCGGRDDSCRITAVGRHWIAVFDERTAVTVFQNLATGQVSADPTGVRTLPDLNSATLASRVCSPLRLPPSRVLDAGRDVPVLGPLDFVGRFALATSSDALSNTVYLERCGSRLHKFICHCPRAADADFRSLAANTRVVIWSPAASYHLDGLRLPSRRRFLIPLPPAVVQQGYSTLMLSSRTLYISVGGHVYSAPSPR